MNLVWIAILIGVAVAYFLYEKQNKMKQYD